MNTAQEIQQGQKAEVSRLFSFITTLCLLISLGLPSLAQAQRRTPSAAPAAAAEEDSGSDDNGGGDGSRLNLKGHQLAVSVGHNVLFGDWGERYNDNVSFGFHYIYEPTPIFGFQFNFGYAHHSGLGEDRLVLFQIEPDLRINFFFYDNITMYGAGGFGFYPVGERLGISDGNVLAFGMNLILGLDLKLGDHLVFGPGVAFRSIFSKSDKDVHTPSFPSGMSMGGEFMRLFVQMGYAF